MNIEEESPALPPSQADQAVTFDLPAAASDGDLKTLSANIAKLESDLANEREDRREKEFIYIAVISLLGSPILFKFVDNTWLSTLLFLFELVIITGLAKRMGVDWAVEGLGWLTHWVSERFGKGGEKDK